MTLDFSCVYLFYQSRSCRAMEIRTQKNNAMNHMQNVLCEVAQNLDIISVASITIEKGLVPAYTDDPSVPFGHDYIMSITLKRLESKTPISEGQYDFLRKMGQYSRHLPNYRLGGSSGSLLAEHPYIAGRTATYAEYEAYSILP